MSVSFLDRYVLGGIRISADNYTIPWPSCGPGEITWISGFWCYWEHSSDPSPIELGAAQVSALREHFHIPEFFLDSYALTEMSPQKLDFLSQFVDSLGGYDRAQQFVNELSSHGITLVSYIDSGGWGHVFRGYSRVHDRAVALKVLKPPYSPEWRHRFDKEAAILAKLAHISSVSRPLSPVLEVGNLLCLEMEYVEGHPLSRTDSPHKIDETLVMFKQILHTLAQVHDSGIIHRDLHAGNVLRAPQGPVLVDFGVARDVNSIEYYQTFKPVGAMSHCAPEAWRDPSVAVPSSDIFSVGVMLYRIITGQSPFWESTYIKLYEAISTGNYIPATQRCKSLPPVIDIVIDAFLHPSLKYRVSSAEIAFDVISHCSELVALWLTLDPNRSGIITR